jgi:hypothetical protein
VSRSSRTSASPDACFPPGVDRGSVRIAPLALLLGVLGACQGPRAATLNSGTPGAELAPADTLHLGTDPAAGFCTLTNTGGVDIVWRAETSAPWLEIQGAATGTLRPQASIEIGVAVAAEAAQSLPAGTHEAALRVAIAGAPVPIRSLRVILAKEAPASPPEAAASSTRSAAPPEATAVGAPAAAASAEAGIDPTALESGPGWTVLSPSRDTRAVYVSSSTGNDRNDGQAPARPKRTIAAGKALLRDRSADWLLLQRGDAWDEGLGQWTKSGRSPQEPMVVASYGSSPDRPLLRTGAGDGVTTLGSGGAPPTTENVSFVGLRFESNGYDGSGAPTAGARILRPSKHLLFEDCLFQAYHTNLVLQGYEGRHEDLRIRRCVIVDAYARHAADNGHPQGLYAFAVDGLLVEESVFDHNGWSAAVPDAGPDMFCHDLYIDNGNTGVTVRGNIIANAASHGMQLRCGGTATDNLFLGNAIALSVGGGVSPEPAGVTAVVTDNVILEGRDIDASQPRGWGLWFGNIAGGQVTGNVVAHNANGRRPFALTLAGDEDRGIGVHDLRLSGNVFYDWGGGILVEGDGRQLTGISLDGNDLQEPRLELLVDVDDADGLAGLTWSNNRLHGRSASDDGCVRIDGDRRPRAQWPAALDDLAPDAEPAAYPEPQRGVPSYCHSLGRDPSTSLVEQARAQSKSRWNPELTAAAVNRFVREGFGLIDG